jgi:acetyltransferase-like isoleucine patch superfamily enzyme
MNIVFDSFFSRKALKVRLHNHKVSSFCLFDKVSELDQYCRINRFAIVRKSQIGKYTFIGPNSNIINSVIGSFCSISKNVTIGTATHPISFFSTNPIFYSKSNGTGSSWTKKDLFQDQSPSNRIGNDVWIGMNATILGGITVGDGAIIGAHALVTKDVPPYSVVGGVPAKFIKPRFDEKIVEQLLLLKWWNLPVSFLENNYILFAQNLDQSIIDEINSRIRKTT